VVNANQAATKAVGSLPTRKNAYKTAPAKPVLSRITRATISFEYRMTSPRQALDVPNKEAYECSQHSSAYSYSLPKA